MEKSTAKKVAVCQYCSHDIRIGTRTCPYCMRKVTAGYFPDRALHPVRIKIPRRLRKVIRRENFSTEDAYYNALDARDRAIYNYRRRVKNESVAEPGRREPMRRTVFDPILRDPTVWRTLDGDPI
jgi:hypothetical protein